MESYTIKARQAPGSASKCRLMKTLVVTLCVSVILYSCEEFVEIDNPPTQIPSENVFSNESTATAAIVGIYARMFKTGGITSAMTRSNGLVADELVAYSGTEDINFYNNNLSPISNTIGSYWSELYQYIYSANLALEGLSSSETINNETTRQLRGEAKFIRAFCYFYLTNLWREVPLITSTDYRLNASETRNTREEIYDQIVRDLRDAEDDLPDDYAVSNGDRSRPNKWAAKALLARVYLYTADWSNAAAEATAVIGNELLFVLEDDVGSVFLKNSREAIWQLSSTFSGGGINTFDAEIFISTSTTSIPTMALDTELIKSFTPNDERRINWRDSIIVSGTTYHYPYKYKVEAAGSMPPITEYLMVLRLAELYLIRAEARLHESDMEGARADINAIRQRAGLPDTPANDEPELLLAIEQERRFELFAEWGHRWLDLKRTQRADAVLGLLKPNWQSTDVLYPLPQSEMDKNPNLIPQNDGY